MSAGRGLAIPVSLYWTNSKQLTMLVSGLFLTLLLCNVLSWLALYELVVYLGSGLLGLFASSVYPLTMSMPASLRLKATSRNTSIYAMGGCVGVALLPFVVGMAMERFGPNSLFVCMQAIAVGMVVLFICVQRTNKQITYKPPAIDALQESQITTVE
jgi:fucose permease